MPSVSQSVSEVLKGCWRLRPDPASISEGSLVASLGVLTSTGAGGLAWNRIKGNSRLAASRSGEDLQRHAQMLALDAARHETALGALAQLFQGARIMPLHFKGWAAAQYYGAVHLRAMGDVDLCAPPGRFDAVDHLLRGEGFRELSSSASPEHGRTVLLRSPAQWPGKRLLVDLHERLDKFFLGPLEEVFSRAQRAQLGSYPLLVPGPEDHLRIVAMHFLRDGGWRASTLCDVGAMLERLPVGFDWDLALGVEPRQRRWIVCTLELASILLGAPLENMPAACRVRKPPSWLRRTVLRSWERPMSHHRARVPFAWILRHHQSSVPEEALARWPNGIRASVELNAPFTRLPRWPYQLLFFARSIGRFAVRGLSAGAQ